MTCRQLGGGCNQQFHAETFEEMAKLSQQHGMEMMRAGDADHLRSMEAMKALMSSPQDMKSWMEEKRRIFEALPHNA